MSENLDSQFDKIYDKIFDTLQDYTESLPENSSFYLYRDHFRDVEELEPGAHVFMYMGNLSPSKTGSSSNKHYHYSAEYNFDLIACSPAKIENGEYIRADILAAKRLRVLILQIWNALYGKGITSLGVEPGKIFCNFMDVSMVDYSGLRTENIIVGAVGTMKIEMAYQVAGIEAADLEKISISNDSPVGFGLEIEFEQEEL